MQTSEFEYHLISELIGMSDRELAKAIELAIWPTSSSPNSPVLERFVRALEECDDDGQFEGKARDILASLPKGINAPTIGGVAGLLQGYHDGTNT